MIHKNDNMNCKIAKTDKIMIQAENIIEPPLYDLEVDVKMLDSYLVQINKPSSISCDRKEVFPKSTLTKLLRDRKEKIH